MASSLSQPEVVEVDMVAVLREKTPAQRLSIAFGLWRFARATLRRRLAADHPDWTPEQVAQEAARRMLSGA